MTWEVALVYEESSRKVLAREVDTSQLFAYIAAALEERPPGAVLVSRSDSLPETWRSRESTLIDTSTGTTESGKSYTRRKMRYGKMSMKDWDLLMRLNRWRPKPKKAQTGLVLCSRGDAQCACLVLNSRCRLEE